MQCEKHKHILRPVECVICMQAENKRLKANLHRCHATSVKYLSELAARRSQVKWFQQNVKKLLLCFPDKLPEGQEEVSFNIPAYIIEDMKKELSKP